MRRSRQRVLIAGFVAGLAVALAIAVSGLVGTTQEDTSVPLPFDPPSGEEKEQARLIALSNATIQDALGDRFVYLGAALHTQKEPATDSMDHRRLLDTWFYDYASDRVAWAVVAPLEAKVVEVVAVDFAFEPPLAGVEIERALELARQSEVVAERFPGGVPAVTASLVSGEGTECPQNRCLVLAFIEHETLVMDFMVFVNLSEDRVVKVVEDWREVYRP